MGLQNQVGGTHVTEANLVDGMEQGVAAGHPLQALFKPRLAADSLNIAMHHDRSVISLGPAKGHSRALKREQINGVGVVRESLQFGRSLHREALITKGLNQTLKVGEDSRQDGEMGHRPNPALTDPSYDNRAEQAPLQLGVMASGNGSNFEALAQAIQAGNLNARIKRLVVNNPGCGAQQRAERLGIPVSVLDHRLIKDRRELDGELVRLFRADQVELVVMAGWMRIVTDVLVSGYSERLINIHPSLLPSFRGLDAIGQALKARVKLTGCTVHIVTEELDAGPILAQAAVPVLEGDDHARLAERIQEQEHLLLPRALAGLKPTWRQG